MLINNNPSVFEDSFDAESEAVDDVIDLFGLEKVQSFDRVGGALVPSGMFIIARSRADRPSKRKYVPTGKPRGRSREPFRLKCDDLWRRRKSKVEARAVMLRWARDPANNWEVLRDGANVVEAVRDIYKKNDALECEGKMQKNPTK